MRARTRLQAAAVLLTATASLGRAAAQTPLDIAKDPYRDEITHAVVRLKVLQAPKGVFSPVKPIRAGELLAGLNAAAARYPDVFRRPALPQSSAALLTREQAVAAVAEALRLWPERQSILMETSANVNPLRYFAEDGGFRDAGSVNKAWRQHYAVLIYLAVVPDAKELKPRSPCTRAYAAALLARAVPGNGTYTGLAIDCGGGVLPAAGSTKVKTEDQVKTPRGIFPAAGRMPNRPFLMCPGLASINPKLEVVQARRVGANPLIVKALRVEGDLKLEGCPIAIVSAEDAAKIEQLARSSLILHTWRVGVFNYHRTEKQRQAALEAAAAASGAQTAPEAPAPGVEQTPSPEAPPAAEPAPSQ